MRQDSFVFELTQRCNHDCLHCYNVWKNQTLPVAGRHVAQPPSAGENHAQAGAPVPHHYPQGELDTAGTLDILSRMLKQTKASLVSLSGGEPLLREDLVDIVRFLDKRGVRVNLITNGSLLTAEVIAELGRMISVYELPLLSSDRAIHDRMSGAQGAFDRATLAMAELKAAGQRIVGVFVATLLNLPTWRRTVEVAVALGLDGIMFNRFNPGGRGADHVDLLQASPEALTEALDVAEELSERYAMPISCSIPMPPCLFDTSRYKRLSFGFCAAGTDRAYYTLDPVGNVRPCNHSPTILGNIRETKFARMARSDAMRRFMDARPDFCRGCAREAECLGGCKAAAEACCGNPCVMDPFLAAFSKSARKPAGTRS